jgi:translocation and assembly module TamA
LHATGRKLNPPTRWRPVRGLVLLAAALWVVSARALDVTVSIEGVDGDLRKNVEAFLQIYQERDAEAMRPARLRRLHGRAPEQIREALQPFGYYNVEVESELRREEDRKDEWVASYRIDPGEPVMIASVDYLLEGEATDDVDFPQIFGLLEGTPLDHARWEAAKDELLFAAAERGYLDARLKHSRIVVDPERNTADVEVHFDSGERYYFGPVRFRQDMLRTDYLQRYVGLERGAPYDQNAVLRLQTSLLDTDYFSRVEMVPMLEEADPATNEVPLEVHISPNKRDKYRAGLGYATDIGPKLTLDWTRRWVNRRGHRTKAELVYAQKYQSLLGEYWVPLKKPATEHIRYKAEVYHLETDTRIEDVASVDVAHSVKRRGWRRDIGVEFRYEDYDIADEQNDLNELVPYIELSRTVADNPLYTSRGYRVKLGLRGTVKYVGSTSNYISATASGKWIRAFGGAYRFLTRADLGITWADSIEDVPGSRRFFAGGDQSIRGYGFEDLGPRDPGSGDVVGGRYLGVGSLELERRIKGNWSGAVFYDFGNAFDPDLDNDFKQAVGIGGRWRSPIGQIRLDVAVGIESDDTPVRLHLVIGPDL